MSANSQSQEFFDCVRAIAGPAPLHRLALTVAQMIAAATRAGAGTPFTQNDAPVFLDQTRELTKGGWFAIVAALAEQWDETNSDRLVVNPFEPPSEVPPLAPGAPERLRKLILGYVLPHGASKPSAPSWLLHSALELMDPRDLLGRTPKGADSHLRDLVVETVGATTKNRIFCAYDHAAGVALELAVAGADVTFDVPQEDLATLCACLAFAAKLNWQVRAGDPLELARHEFSTPLLADATFDTSVVFPPFGLRYAAKSEGDLQLGLTLPPGIEAAGLTLALARGRKAALCVLPPSFLFQTTKVDQAFKEQIIRRYGLDSVVGLPRGVFGGTSMAAAMMVFKPASLQSARSTSPDLFMVDARDLWDHPAPDSSRISHVAQIIRQHEPTDISLSVSIAELEANDFNLSVERYVLDPETRRLRDVTAKLATIPLSEVAELYRPQAIPSTKREAVPSNLSAAEVGVADIDEAGLVRSPGKQLALPPDAAPQARRARLEAGDVLLVIKGSVGKVGFVRDIPPGETWLASQSFVILRLRQHAPLSDPRLLFRFLNSSLGNASIQSLRVGVAVPGLQMADVKRLMIVLPDPKTQAAIVRDIEGIFDLQDRIQGLRTELTSRQAEIWPEGLGVNPREAADTEPAARRPKTYKKTTS